MKKINDILNERAKTHGSYKVVARLDMDLNTIFNFHHKCNMSDELAMALKMIFHKIARIGAGNANFIDHWQDIIGYAQLAINSIEEAKQEKLCEEFKELSEELKEEPTRWNSIITTNLMKELDK